MRLIQEALSPNVQEAIRLQHRGAAPRARFGIGGGCTPRTATPPPGSSNCPSPPVVPGCIRPGRTCDVSRVGATQVVTGGQPFSIIIEPTRVTWFQPLGVRCVITDLSNSDLSHRVFFTGVTINETPQESVNNITPTAPAAAGDRIDGWWSDDWIDPDGYAVPVGWGWISRESNTNQLKVHGIALGIPNTTDVLVSVSLYGNGANSVPAGIADSTQPRYRP